jgi:hypothetical protein
LLPCNVEIVSGSWTYDATNSGYKTSNANAQLLIQFMHPDNIVEGVAAWGWVPATTRTVTPNGANGGGHYLTVSDFSGDEFVGNIAGQTVTLKVIAYSGSAARNFVKLSGFGTSGVTFVDPFRSAGFEIDGCVGGGVARLGTVALSDARTTMNPLDAVQCNVAVGANAITTPTLGSTPVFWGGGVGALNAADQVTFQGVGFHHTAQTQPATASGCIDCTIPTDCARQVKVTIIQTGTPPGGTPCGVPESPAGNYILDYTGVPGLYSLYIGPDEAGFAAWDAAYQALPTGGGGVGLANCIVPLWIYAQQNGTTWGVGFIGNGFNFPWSWGGTASGTFTDCATFDLFLTGASDGYSPYFSCEITPV